MLDCLPVEIDVKCCFSVQFTDGTIRYYSVRKALNISVMKNRKILGLLCCAFVEVIFVSCAQNRDHGHPEAEYGLEISPEDDTLEFSELYSSYDFVRLKNAMVSDVTDVVALDSIYIVRCSACGADENPEHCSMVSIFSKEGEYLAPLIYQGRGPEEVLTIEDMCYNDMSGTFDVLCNYGQYIYRYDLSERKPVVKIALDRNGDIYGMALNDDMEFNIRKYVRVPNSDNDRLKAM